MSTGSQNLSDRPKGVSGWNCDGGKKNHEAEKKYRKSPKGVSEWMLIFSREIKKYETFGSRVIRTLGVPAAGPLGHNPVIGFHIKK